MDTKPDTTHHVPERLEIAAAWAWRILILIALAAVVIYGLSQVVLLWVPLVAAGFLAGLLNPIVRVLVDRGVRRLAATIITFLSAITAFGWLLVVVIEQLFKGFDGIWDQAMNAAKDLDMFIEVQRNSLPIPVPPINLHTIGAAIAGRIEAHTADVANQIFAIGSGASAAVTGIIITLFAGFFFIYQGAAIWRFLVTLLPQGTQETIDIGAQYGWVGVVSYVRFQAGIAVLEGIWIGTAAHLLGLQLAVPLGLFVLLGAMIPILGALITGAVAVLLAFATGGLVSACLMAVAVLGINQLETVVLQPWIMGKAVNLHPLVILLSVIGGATVGDVIGALIAVPLVAFIVAAAYGIRDHLAGASASGDPTVTP
ncbi:AI-2E family transporter [Stomatohabitans albus]|uniref:AI-2E family transporter n=1 Tax=Stomatohabitans albus TaxID=3110766 RepID=UPI00300D6D61